MKDYIEERVLELAHYIIRTNATVRSGGEKISGFKIYGTYSCGYL